MERSLRGMVLYILTLAVVGFVLASLLLIFVLGAPVSTAMGLAGVAATTAAAVNLFVMYLVFMKE